MLRQTPVIAGVGMLATVNSVLSEHRAAHRGVQKILNDRLLTTELVAKVTANEVAGPVSPAFSRGSGVSSSCGTYCYTETDR